MKEPFDPQQMTRAQRILFNSKPNRKTNSRAKNDIVTIAGNLGIQVRYLEEYEDLLDRMDGKKRNERDRKAKKVSSHAKKTTTKRKLKAPFLKVEDRSMLYQPLIKEMDTWPRIFFDSVQPNCPFEPPAPRTRKQTKTHLVPSSSTKRSGGVVKAKLRLSSSKKVGYCELCDIHYKELEQHLRGAKHRKNASNSDTYREFDNIARQGRSAGAYIERVGSHSRSRNSKVER